MNTNTKGKKIIFIFAHPDDEAYGPAGTISKLAENNNVYIVSICRGDRPGYESVSSPRKEAFMKSNKLLGTTAIILDNSDAKLQYEQAIKDVEMIIKNYSPDVVYTHNISDLHKDHRIVSEACLVACRPKPGSTVKALYMCESPVATGWSFNKIDPKFDANTYVDVCYQEECKRDVLELYSTEIYEWPDARSVESMETLAKYRGKQIGVNMAEAFSQVFRLY